jgi:Phage P22-like portal protein
MKRPRNAETTAKKVEKASVSDKDRKFLDLALKRFKASATATAEVRREALEDFKFRTGQQWPPEIARAYGGYGGKVMLTVNRTAAFCNQVTNEQRQQRPQGTVLPVGSGADQDTAEILQGMVRHVEVNCDAEVADDIAFEHMVIGGFGWLRMWSEDIDDDPDNEWAQEIKIGAVPNPFTVYDDPGARHPLKIDAKWRFFVEDLPKEEYQERYGESKLAASLQNFSSIGDSQPEWINQDVIRIAEYYVVEYTEEKIYLLNSGETVRGIENLPEGAKVIKERTKQTPKVMWYLINALEILEQHEVPGKIIPSFPVLGYSLNVDGKQYLAGLVRTAKDPARAYNYHLSKATQAVALAPKMPFIATAKQTEGFEREWQTANTGDLAVLHYNPDQGAPPPTRDVAEPPIQAITHLLVTADNDMKAVTSLYDPSLGQKTSDQSGKAIVALQRQGNVATANFSDNLARTKRELTRNMLAWIPIIYDAPAVRRIINPDGTATHAAVFNSKTTGLTPEEAQEQIAEEMEDKKISKIYDIGVGRYDVTVSVGPSFQTKRQEQAQQIMQLISAYPELMHVCGDILISDMDFEQAKEIAERVKRTIPPNILGEDDGTDPEESLARKDAELQQLMQQHQQLAQELQQASQVIQTKQVEAKNKFDIAKMQQDAKDASDKLNRETQITVAEINTKAQMAQTRLEYEHDMWKILHTSAHDIGLQADQNAADAAQAQQAQQAAAQQQASQQNADANSQAADQAFQGSQAQQPDQAEAGQ